ncbi:MAG: hypothetical protein DWQ04_06570 [Chloroflexi bacterium]|nr:MAG: hypothetical protein DWQ04_06570 [Chloroflexota bacterium]
MTAKEKVTLTLPRSLIEAIREMAPPRGQSKFVAEAVEYFIEKKRRQILREELVAGYKATAEESLAFTKKLEAADNEDWLTHVPPYEGEELPHDEKDS